MLKLKNMNEKRFVHHGILVKDYVESLENKNMKGKMKQELELLETLTFLRNKKSNE